MGTRVQTTEHEGQQGPRPVITTTANHAVSVMSKSDAFLQAGRTAVLQNIHGTMQFLQRFPPFNQMENTHLAYLVEQCQLRFYAPGESIIRPTDGPVEHFYIVKQGRVVGERTHVGREEAQTTFEITAGECFPLAALLGERATRTEHRAAEDTFCLQLNKLAFIKLFGLSDEFRDFALRGVSSLLDKVNQQVQQKAAETLGTQYSLNTRLGELAMRHPVTCAPCCCCRWCWASWYARCAVAFLPGTNATPISAQHRVYRGLSARDPADPGLAGAFAAVIAASLGRPGRQAAPNLHAGDSAAVDPGDCRRFDLHLLADLGRLHRAAACGATGCKVSNSAWGAPTIKVRVPACAPPVPPINRSSMPEGVGETLALRGAWDRQIPECVSCHGPGGAGVGSAFPPLANQPAMYLVAQLNAWRDGSRQNDPNYLMGHIAKA